jgi:4,5-DOPA dioxygenase extradiol
MSQPSLFVSHGSPMTVLQDDDAYAHSLRSWAGRLQGAKGLIVVSAHTLTEEDTVEVSSPPTHELLYDFRSFPGELYQQQWRSAGAPEIVPRILRPLSEKGFQTDVTRRPIDHGVWVPLKLAFPEPTLPLVQVSLPYPTRPEKALLLGRALAPLREEGWVLVGSGGIVHNLGRLRWHEKAGAPAPWAQAFEDWVIDCLERKDVGALVAFAEEGPEAGLAHPTPEHFFPIFFTLGASLPGDRLELVHREIQYHTLSMAVFALSGGGTADRGLH